jgi:hypothetical protein
MLAGGGSWKEPSIMYSVDGMQATAQAQEMERGEYGVRFARPTTLAGGDHACSFRFFPTPPDAALSERTEGDR